VLIPALTPLAFLNADDAVRLGRLTVWQEIEDGGVAPAGQKMFLVDDEEFAFLELRQLEFHARQTDSEQHAPTQ
jgi:type VI secretion system protein ImpE